MRSQILVAVGLVLGPLLLGRPRTVRVPSAGRGNEPLTIVIPARDEAAQIDNVLGDLAIARPASSRVVVVDDDSSDDTARRAARYPFVEIVAGAPLPDGWTGKAWACHQGALRASGGMLAFVDADVRLEAGALDSLVSEARSRGGLVSVQPYHEVCRPYEALSALFNVVAAIGARLGHRYVTAAFGPVMVTSIDDYRRVGGHAGVRDEVAEDLALGRAYHRAGLGVHSLAGGSAVRFRMYPSGLRQLVEGWSKNFATGAGRTPALLLAGAVGWIAALGSVSMGILGFGALAYGEVGAWSIAWYLCGVVAFRASAGRVGSFGWATAVLLPVHVCCFVAVFAWSVWCTLIRGSVTWRGREIAVRGRRERAP